MKFVMQSVPACLSATDHVCVCVCVCVSVHGCKSRSSAATRANRWLEQHTQLSPGPLPQALTSLHRLSISCTPSSHNSPCPNAVTERFARLDCRAVLNRRETNKQLVPPTTSLPKWDLGTLVCRLGPTGPTRRHNSPRRPRVSALEGRARVCVCERMGTPISGADVTMFSGHVRSFACCFTTLQPQANQGLTTKVPGVTKVSCDNCATSSRNPVAERTLPTFCFNGPMSLHW